MRTYTCVVCPNGCEIDAEMNGGVLVADGALCPKGEEYVRQEMTDPRRTISTLVKVAGGERDTVSARLSHPVPLAKIRDVMALVRGMECAAPIRAGQALADDLLGLGCRLIAVDDVAEKNGEKNQTR